MDAREAYLDILGPDGSNRRVGLTGPRLTIGRLGGANDIALEPDPQLLVTRQVHCFVERDGGWWVVDNGSVNGTFLQHGGTLARVDGRAPLTDGDCIQVLAGLSESGEPVYWRIQFSDPQKTRQAGSVARAVCLDYDWLQARLFCLEGTSRTEIRGLRPQEHKLIRYMAQRNRANGDVPVLCTHQELIAAVWGEEAYHTQDDVAHLIWGLRQKLESSQTGQRLLSTERGLGYRLRTCG